MRLVLLLLLALSPSIDETKTTLRVVGGDEFRGEIYAEPYLPPFLTFKLISGPMPTPEEILECSWQKHELGEPIRGSCDNGAEIMLLGVELVGH